MPGAARAIIETLARFGLESDEPVTFQSERSDGYHVAFAKLQDAGLVYGCACSRRDVETAIEALGGPINVYPGTCARGAARDKQLRAYRVRVPEEEILVADRAAGSYAQNLSREVGDFVVKRADAALPARTAGT